MTTFLLILCYIGIYLSTGFLAARAARPRILSYCTYEKGDKYIHHNSYGRRWEYRKEAGLDREDVSMWTWLMIWGWPIFSWVFAIKQGLKKSLDDADPQVQQLKIERQRQRITELEQELRVGRS